MRVFTLCKSQLDRLLSALDAILQAILTGNNASVITADVEYVCNETTNVWDQITTTYTDGVATSQSTIPTIIPCSDPAPAVPVDYEIAMECRAGIITRVIFGIDAAGVATEISATPTGEPCASSVPTIGEPVCATIDGGDPSFILPAGVFDPVTGTFASNTYLDPNTMAPITGAVVVGDPCDCDCDCSCDQFSGCMGQIFGFDYLDHSDWTAGPAGLMTWLVDGVPVDIDVATLPAAGNKSTWYQPLWDLLPPEFTVSVVNDVGPESGDKPTFQIDFSGEVCNQIVHTLIRQTGTPGDTITLVVNTDGTATLSVLDGGANPFGSPTVLDCAGVDVASSVHNTTLTAI